MIPVTTLLYEIDMKLNKVATFKHQGIPVENKIIALNEAQINLVKARVSPNQSSVNFYGIGLDGFKKRHHDLQVLIEEPSENKVIPVLSDEVLNKWDIKISDLKKPFMFFIDGYALATKDSCKDHPIFINGDLIKHADVTTLLKNSNTKPSFEYQETFSTISGNEIEIYSDGTFSYTEAYISYIRYPKSVDLEGYEHLDGTPSVTVDCELEEYLKNEIVNLAIKELGIITENSSVVQTINERMSTQE